MIERSVRWCRRRPLVAALIALSVLLAAGFLITVTVLNERLRDALARAELRTEEQRQQIVQLNIHIGITHVDSGDIYAAILRFVEALRLDEGTAEEAAHRVRIAKLLRQSPRLIQHRIATDPILCVGHRDSLIEVATIRDGQILEISDAMTDRPIGAGFQLSSTPRLAALSDDGRWIATVTDNDKVHVWDRKTKAVTPLPLRSGASVARVAFHSDNSTLAVHHISTPPSLWSLTTETPAEKPLLGTDGALTALSDNGQWLLRIGDDNVGRVWDVAAGQNVASIATRSGASMAAISSDGQHVAVLDPRHNLTIYDAQAGWHEQYVQIPASLKEIVDANFSADGRKLLLCDSTGSVCACDTVKGQALTPTIRHHGPLVSARFMGDRKFVTVTKSGIIKAWELVTDAVDPSDGSLAERPVPQLIALAQVLAGGWINPLQAFEPLNSKALQSRWEQVNSR
jgi:WD40 repeat protein